MRQLIALQERMHKANRALSILANMDTVESVVKIDLITLELSYCKKMYNKLINAAFVNTDIDMIVTEILEAKNETNS